VDRWPEIELPAVTNTNLFHFVCSDLSPTGVTIPNSQAAYERLTDAHVSVVSPTVNVRRSAAFLQRGYNCTGRTSQSPSQGMIGSVTW
jgi:hypothetical protein